MSERCCLAPYLTRYHRKHIFFMCDSVLSSSFDSVQEGVAPEIETRVKFDVPFCSKAGVEVTKEIRGLVTFASSWQDHASAFVDTWP